MDLEANVHTAVVAAIDEVNEQLDPAACLGRTAQVPLLPPRADSLTIVSLFVAIESHVARLCGKEVVLTDDSTMGQLDTVLATLPGLVSHVSQRLHP